MPRTPLIRLAQILLGCAFAMEFAMAAELAPSPPLTTVRAVRALTRDEALRHYPVKLHGVITYYEPVRFLAFLQDDTDGIYISLRDPAIFPGAVVDITGVTAPGAFACMVEGANGSLAQAAPTGRAPFPQPIPADPAHLHDETYDAEWVAISGAVTAVRQNGGRAELTLETPSGPISAIIPGYYERDLIPGHLEGLTVTAQGVIGISRDRDYPSAPVATQLLVPSLDQITIDSASLAARLEAPSPTYRDLIAPGKYQSQIVRVRGQVTLLDPGRGFFVDMSDPVDWKRALWVNTAETSRLQLGQRVDAVGQVDVFSFELALRDALVRPLEPGLAPVPARLQADRLANVDCQGKLVIVDAKLIDTQSTVDEDIWVFSAGNGVAYAKLPAASGRLPHFAKDSRVQICGIALRHRAPGFDAPPKPFAYQIWMRGPGDGRLLSAPSWWTPRRIQWLVGALLVLAAAVAVWNSLLHRKVRTQTEIIRRHVATQTIHQERARIARDLHDEIGSNLGSLTLLTQIAQEEFKDDENARHEFGEIHRIARKTYDSLRDIVWLTASDSPDPKVLEHRLRETAEMMLSSIQHTVSLNLAALPRELPLEFARHVLLIFKEALHNAVRHADATLITVTALASPARLSLRISDNGRGFDPAKVTESAGLPSVRERAHLLRAELQIRSAPGAGAEFILDAPLAAAT